MAATHLGSTEHVFAGHEDVLLEHAPNAIVVVDADGRMVLVNRLAVAMFGYSRDDLLGQCVDMLVPEALRAAHRPRRESFAHEHTGRAMGAGRELWGRCKGGELIPIEIGLAPLQTASGRYVLASIIDVSERRRAEARLHELSELHRAIVAQAGYAIIATDRDGLITAFNPAAEQMLGWRAGEMIGCTSPQRFHDAAELEERRQELAAELGEPVAPGFGVFVARARRGLDEDRDWTFVRKDGTRLHVRLSVTPLRDRQGRIDGYLGMAVDMTDKRRAEEQMRAKNAELHAFAYTVSHDLKAPLRGITGYAQELERRHLEGLGERGRFCVAQIIAATRNLDCLIEDLLKYSRLDAEVPTPTTVALPTLVAALLRDRQHTIAERNAELDIQVPAITLQVWERGLQQVLANLIDNAIKYSRNAKPPRIGVHARAQGGRCEIRISDNGIGFDMKYCDRIFGLFNRLVRASEFEGTGAGLAIVRKVLEKLGGTIRADSAPGQGATFIVELPQAADGAPP